MRRLVKRNRKPGGDAELRRLVEELAQRQRRVPRSTLPRKSGIAATDALKNRIDLFVPLAGIAVDPGLRIGGDEAASNGIAVGPNKVGKTRNTERFESSCRGRAERRQVLARSYAFDKVLEDSLHDPPL